MAALVLGSGRPEVILALALGALGGVFAISVAERLCHSQHEWTRGARIASVTAFAASTTAARFAAADHRVFVTLIAAMMALHVVSLVDIAEGRIPNRVTYPLFVSCVLLAAGAIVIAPGVAAQRLPAALVASAMFGAILLAVHAVRPDGMGLGDVKLALPIGFALGWFNGTVASVPLMISLTVASACVLGLFGAAVSWARPDWMRPAWVRPAWVRPGQPRRHRLREQSVPFGPALAAAGTAALVMVVPG